MAQISATLVKTLRERTGSGMMECKRALQETNGDLEAAIELMRKSGLAKADKKASRVAAEGLITVHQSAQAIAMVEVNCETDFVARHEDFQGFVKAVAELVLQQDPVTLEALSALPLRNEETVEQTRRTLIAKIGENIGVRRFTRLPITNNVINYYVHGDRIGVIVELDGGDETLAKDIAMHVAAIKPVCVEADQVPKELLDKEREIFSAQAAASGKPDNIIEKMVEGRLRKYLAEITLVGQPFVKDPDQTVAELLAKKGAKVKRFVRFELGEGIEKKDDNFVEEVMAQAKGS
jgi:elongation factor Ts